MGKLTIQILDVTHREKLIAEIQCGYYVIAEINQDSGSPQIELFSYDEAQIEVDLDEFITILAKAKNKLIEGFVFSLSSLHRPR